MKYLLQISSVFCLLFCLNLITGCSEPPKEISPQFLIRTKTFTLSSTEFLEELDLKKAAYPYNIKKSPTEYNAIVISLVKMLSEEIVLISAAADKQIIVTDKEVNLAEKEFKKDYPDDSFDQILLENAISYTLWKKRFKKNLIIEKLVDKELRQKVEITSNDIVQFYNNNILESSIDTDKSKDNLVATNKIGNETELVKRLRMQKTQESYSKWILNLYKAYPVEINKELLKTFLIKTNVNEDKKNDEKN